MFVVRTASQHCVQRNDCGCQDGDDAVKHGSLRKVFKTESLRQIVVVSVLRWLVYSDSRNDIERVVCQH